MRKQLYPHLDWPLERLAQEATRAFIEREGVSQFDQHYTQLESQIRRYSDNAAQQRVYATIQLIDATRLDSPKRDPTRCALTLIWLARHHQVAATHPLKWLIDEMLPDYAEEYGSKAARSCAHRHRGYLVYTAEGTGQHLWLTSVLAHPDEATELLVHGRDASRGICREERAMLDRYNFSAWPGERIQFTITRGQERSEAWYTVTTVGPLEEPSHSTIWLAIMHHAALPTRGETTGGEGLNGGVERRDA
jgi:hypothetical protein